MPTIGELRERADAGDVAAARARERVWEAKTTPIDGVGDTVRCRATAHGPACAIVNSTDVRTVPGEIADRLEALAIRVHARRAAAEAKAAADAAKPRPRIEGDRFYGHGYAIDLERLRRIAMNEFRIERPLHFYFRDAIVEDGVEGAGAWGFHEGEHRLQALDSLPLWPLLRVLVHELIHAETAEAGGSPGTLAADVKRGASAGGAASAHAREIEAMAERAVEAGWAGKLLPAVIEPEPATSEVREGVN